MACGVRWWWVECDVGVCGWMGWLPTDSTRKVEQANHKKEPQGVGGCSNSCGWTWWCASMWLVVAPRGNGGWARWWRCVMGGWTGWLSAKRCLNLSEGWTQRIPTKTNHQRSETPQQGQVAHNAAPGEGRFRDPTTNPLPKASHQVGRPGEFIHASKQRQPTRSLVPIRSMCICGQDAIQFRDIVAFGIARGTSKPPQ